MYSVHKLFKYKTGIITDKYLNCSHISKEVNHGVVLVGYGTRKDEEVKKGDCTDYFIIRNSWGSDWGEDGFFKLCIDDLDSQDKKYGTC